MVWERTKKVLRQPFVGALALLALTACGGGGGGPTTPKVQPVADAQQATILMNISAGSGPASWVLFQYDDKNQLYNVFVNRNQLPSPVSRGRPDLGAVTGDPNNWDSYAKNTVTVLGTTASLTLDAGSTQNTYTTTSQALSDFITGNPTVVQTAWNEISVK
jgi:hypothetical protein